MGCKSNKKVWFQGGSKKKAWGHKSWEKKSWKKKWDKKCDSDDRDFRKDGFDKKVFKFDCDFDMKLDKGWKFKCFDGWKKKIDISDCKVELKLLPDVCDLPLPEPQPPVQNCKIKLFKCDFNWKGCGVDLPDPCKPQPPIVDEADNNAPVITQPTQTTIAIADHAGDYHVTTVVAEDLDGDTLVFSINDATDPDSADADMFMIDSATGQVTMTETPYAFGSADGDDTYQIEVQVTDGQETDSIVLDFIYFSAA